MNGYGPFPPGRHAITTFSFVGADPGRRREFPIEVRHPARPEGPLPLILFSHAAAQGRKSASYLTSHLASHGYAVAAMDHSELVAPELARPATETDAERARRWRAVIDARVPDLRFLLDRLLGGGSPVELDARRIGAAGHSFGGWSVLAAAEADPRIRAVAAMAPAGAANPRPGILPATLAFAGERGVPTLYLAAENDTSTPLAGIVELFGRTRAAKRLIVLRRADHLHFRDDAGEWHERFRTLPAPPELAELQKEMRPVGELQTGEQAHEFARGLVLAHFDAVLREMTDAERFLEGDPGTELASRGIDAFVHR
jgi:dienelactone hydrolase